MSERSKPLVLVVIAYLSLNVQCRELLNDFLDFQDQNSHIFFNRTCSEHLTILKNALEENEVWALKGKKNSC